MALGLWRLLGLDTLWEKAKLRVPGREEVPWPVVAAILTISPQRHRLGLYWRTYPRDFVNATRAAEFLRGLLRHLRGSVTVVWDGGPMHKGEPICRVLHDYPRLTLERLPPYAPELNPVEYLWTHLKYGQLPNFLPGNVFELNETLRTSASHCQHRLWLARLGGLPCRLLRRPAASRR
jgi:transposase